MIGLRTTIYKCTDLTAAKSWYARAFAKELYFDEPFYVGFNIGGFEPGLLPDERTLDTKTDNILSYWGVDDIHAEYARFLQLGAREHEAPRNVGGEIVVASVVGPWGNVLGLIHNPEFAVA